MDLVRRAFDELIGRARERLLAGAPVERIQEHYVARAFHILEEAEVLALLASEGEGPGIEALSEHATQLKELHAMLIAEFPP